MKNKLTCIFLLGIIFTGSILLGQSASDLKDNNIPGYIPPDGFVPDETTALKIAKAVWSPIYGKKDLRWRTYSIELVDNVWVIAGGNFWIKFFAISGGGPYIEIDKTTGEILKVTHTK